MNDIFACTTDTNTNTITFPSPARSAVTDTSTVTSSPSLRTTVLTMTASVFSLSRVVLDTVQNEGAEFIECKGRKRALNSCVSTVLGLVLRLKEDLVDRDHSAEDGEDGIFHRFRPFNLANGDFS